MISNKTKIYGWKLIKDGKYTLPAPFDTHNATHHHACKAFGSVGLIPGFSTALLALIQEEILAEGTISLPELNHSHMAIGFSTVESGKEAVYVEYADNDHPDNIEVVKYDPEKSKDQISACMYKTVEEAILPLKMDGREPDILKGDIDPKVVGAWISLTVTMLQEGSLYKFSDSYNNLKDFYKQYYSDKSAVKQEEIDQAWDDFNCLNYYAYQELSLNESSMIALDMDATANQFKVLKKDALDCGSVGPSKGKKFIPNSYKIFKEEKVGGKATKSSFASFDPSTIPFVRKYEDFTEAEKALIPEDDPYENVSEELISTISEIQRTWGKGPEMRCSRILLEGGSGSGKSYLARSIARHLKRPYVTHVIGNTDGPDEFQGVIIPYINVGGRKLAQITEEEYQRYIDNPNLLWPEDLELDFSFDEEAAKEKKANMFEKIKKLFSSIASSASSEAGSSGVKYEYIPSAITEAIEKGYVLEVQEPTCLINQGALSCMFDVLDKGSEGYFKTPMGTIKRHPDFICIVTQNRKYKGTKPLNEAARSRFTHIVRMEDPTAAELIARISKRTGVADIDMISDVVKVYQTLKDKLEDLSCDGVVTPRNLFDFVDALADDVDLLWAFDRKMLNPITTDKMDRQELIEAVEDLPLFANDSLDSLM